MWSWIRLSSYFSSSSPTSQTGWSAVMCVFLSPETLLLKLLLLLLLPWQLVPPPPQLWFCSITCTVSNSGLWGSHKLQPSSLLFPEKLKGQSTQITNASPLKLCYLAIQMLHSFWHLYSGCGWNLITRSYKWKFLIKSQHVLPETTSFCGWSTVLTVRKL